VGGSKQTTLSLSLSYRLGPQHCSHSLIKDLFEPSLREGGALEVLDRPDLVGELLPLLPLEGGVPVLCQSLQGLLVLPQVYLRAYEKDGGIWTVVLDLRAPLGGHILEGGGAHHGEADQEDIRLWIREWPEPVVVLLSRGVPEPQGDRHPVTHHGGGVVVEHCGHIFAGEAVCGVADEHTGLAHGSVPHHHALDRPP